MDRRLPHLYEYINSTVTSRLRGSLSELDCDHVILRAWPDADLNGAELTSKSTSGFWMELAGQHDRFCPISWGSKRQTATSVHTCESEIVSLSLCLRTELIPAQIMLEALLGRTVRAELMEDNAACIVACKKGYSPALRYLSRTQRLSIGFIREATNPETVYGINDNEYGRIEIVKADTKERKGDMFTKSLVPNSCIAALSKVGIG